MITPRFSLTQTETTITITVRAPYSNLKELDVDANGNVFLFNSTPYYLRLNLPGDIVDNDLAKSSFDVDSGEFTFVYEKAVPGEHFPDLEMITKLLCTKVEVPSPDDTNGAEKITILTGVDQQTEIVETLAEDDVKNQFGFALKGNKKFLYISSDFRDVFKVDPKEVVLADRRKLRLQDEQEHFNVDHYLCDYFERDGIVEVMAPKSPWSELKSDQIAFTPSELDFLKDLPNYKYELTDEQIDYCHCCLIEILYAYCYDRRVCGYEDCCESGWNINTVSASLSWLDAFKNPRDALIAGFRRSLIYPLYRNFDLTLCIFQDLVQLLDLGEVFIIKSLIEMHGILQKSDCCRYIINKLFTEDYIVYVMKWDKDKWRSTLAELKKVKVQKEDLGLNLSQHEETALQQQLQQLEIRDDDDDDSSDTSSDSGDSDSSSSEESSSSSSTSSESESPTRGDDES